jgi:hypothetical protein
MITYLCANLHFDSQEGASSKIWKECISIKKFFTDNLDSIPAPKHFAEQNSLARNLVN